MTMVKKEDFCSTLSDWVQTQHGHGKSSLRASVAGAIALNTGAKGQCPGLGWVPCRVGAT
jgi:hypothetical protein